MALVGKKGIAVDKEAVDVLLSKACERSLDLAIRYCKPDSVPEGAAKLFGEEMIPMCSRALVRDKAHPLKRPQDLAHHTLLHFDYAGAETMYMDWGTNH